MLSLLLALSAASPGWSSAVESAEPVKNLGRFLETYVGDCERDDPKMDKAACRAQLKEMRKAYRKKRLFVQVDDLEGLTKVGGFDQRKKAFKVELVPLFAERVLGLTLGKPRKLNRDGQPVLRTVRLFVKRPSGMPEFIFKKKLQQARLELVGEVKGSWRLGKGEDRVEGVELKPVALRLLEGRGDDVLAVRMF